jgi:LacI family transcriptional regulator
MECGSVPPRAKKPVTIYQVAERAGVSPATVSRVMNGIAVDPALAERVREAAGVLNFVPSQTAINLSRNRTQTVSMLVPDLGNPTFQAMLTGLDRAAGADGYWVLVADTHEKADDEIALAREMRRRSDALVLCSPRMDNATLTELLPELAPVAVINRFAAWLPAPVVAIDYRSGVRDLLAHLVNAGHRQVVYLQGNPRSASNEERLLGIADAARENPGLVVHTIDAGVGFSDGFAAAERARATGATAALAFNDLVAMGLISALDEAGVRVPQDFSIVGFDDIPFSAYTTPPLTTVSTAASQLGLMAWERVHALLTGEAPPANALVVPRLVERSSVAAAR